MEKILLGTIRNDFEGITSGQKIYLEKHNFDCGWYWGFGYIGNHRLHTHFDNVFLNSTKNASEIFEETEITNDEWWIIRDLFVQAYALKECSAVYRHGGFQTSKKGITDIIQSDNLERVLNCDLEKVLNKLWDFISNAVVKEKLSKQEAILKFNEEVKPNIVMTGNKLFDTIKLSNRWNSFIDDLYNETKQITKRAYTTWVNPFKKELEMI